MVPGGGAGVLTRAERRRGNLVFTLGLVLVVASCVAGGVVGHQVQPGVGAWVGVAAGLLGSAVVLIMVGVAMTAVRAVRSPRRFR